MGTNILVYPVILSKNGDGYFVTVPDFTINTEGKNIADAIAMARDAIGLNVLQLEANNVTVPEPYSQYFQVQDDDILTLVDIDITDYRNKYENRTVKKNCTIPYRLNVDAEKAGINFSQLLQEALKQKLYGWLWAIEYDKEKTIKMAVQKDGNEYNFTKKDIINLENGLFDIGDEGAKKNKCCKIEKNMIYIKCFRSVDLYSIIKKR